MARRITRETAKSIPLGGLDEGSAGRTVQVDRQPDIFGAHSLSSHVISILQHETVHNVGEWRATVSYERNEGVFTTSIPNSVSHPSI